MQQLQLAASPVEVPCQRAGHDQVEPWAEAPALGQQPWALPGAEQGQHLVVNVALKLVWKLGGNLAWTEGVSEAWKLGEKLDASVGVMVAWWGAEKRGAKRGVKAALTAVAVL